MPTKKESFLIDASEFEKAVKINNSQELEKYSMKLMDLANKYYDEVYLQYKNNPNITAFNNCRQNFNKIGLLLKNKKNSTPLINKLYIEARISRLYSEVHALNLEPETKDDLNNLIEKIQIIGSDFKQLVTKKSGLNSSNENSARLLKYIDAFEQTWKIKEKRLLADIYFNFAEILVENSDFEGSINYFTESIRLYKNAAENAENKLEKNQLLEFASQTNTRREEIKKIISQNMLSKKINVNDQEKKLTLHFKKFSNSASKWTIANEPTSPSIKKPIKGKRKLNNEPFSFKAKKQKIDLWAIERKKILDKFKCLNIAIDLAHLLNNTKTFDERKAIVYNNYAIFLIENLNNKKENYSYSKKTAFLNKVVELLTKSAEVYKNSNLTEEKNNIEHCITTISSSLKNLEAKDSPSIKTQASGGISEKKLREYQHTLSDRVACRLFNVPLPENNTQNTNSRNKKDFSCLSLTR